MARWQKGTNDHDGDGRKGGSLKSVNQEEGTNTMARTRETAGDDTRQTALPEEGQDNIVVGHVYKEDSSDSEVIPYFVDFAAARVNFAGVGRSNEEQMRTSDFLNRFKYVGPVASIAEEQTSNEARLKEQEAARAAEQEAAASRDPARKTGV